MDIRTALTLELGDLHQPVVTSYHLGLLVFRLYQTKTYRGEPIARLSKSYPERSDYRRFVGSLEHSGVLRNTTAVPNKEVFILLGKEISSAEEIACCVDPFAYVSHLSAMEYHGLTDRFPKTLFITAPPSVRWSQLAVEKMRKDIGGEFYSSYLDANLPRLRRLRLPKINRKTVSLFTTVHYDPGAYLSIQGKTLRVSTIGRTFLDMIREPDLCGGIYHVLDVFAEHAPRYLRLIVDKVDRHGSPIDKVRVGYILEERLKLEHPTITTWRAYAKRGGSRKLLAQADYSPHFSETWCLSINIDEPEEA